MKHDICRMAARFFALAVLLAAPMATRAQAPGTPIEQLEPVSVQMRRDASLLPYKRFNELLAGLQKHGQGLFKMEFRLRAIDPARPLQAPRLAVQHEDGYVPITVQPDGQFELPVLPQQQADNADLASNQPKNSMGIAGNLRLTAKPEELDMATVRRIVAVAHKLRSELLPFYLRWLFPQVEGVRVCSQQAQWELEWREQGQLLGMPLSADLKDRAPETPKGATSVPCTTLTGQEAWPDAARLLAPPDAKLSVRLRH